MAKISMTKELDVVKKAMKLATPPPLYLEWYLLAYSND